MSGGRRHISRLAGSILDRLAHLRAPRVAALQVPVPTLAMSLPVQHGTRPMNRINIGCGYDHRPGYLNVDMDAACKPDMLITDKEFSTLPRHEAKDLLKPKGRLIV
jgi:hypothetical protein